MESKLIILRGNSGSGKTTIANCLQTHFGRGTLLVSQDIVRREMIKVKDGEGNLSIDLIRQIAEYGKGKCEIVIVEGILYTKFYGEMLKNLIQYFNNKAFTYYFDLPFEETVRRHNTRTKKEDFGEESLRSWWIEKDYLGVEGERKLTSEMTQYEILELIISQLNDSNTINI